MSVSHKILRIVIFIIIQKIIFPNYFWLYVQLTQGQQCKISQLTSKWQPNKIHNFLNVSVSHKIEKSVCKLKNSHIQSISEGGRPRSFITLRCICHFPFVFILQRIFRCLPVIIHPTPENFKCHTTGQQGPIFNCSLQLRLTMDSGTPCHPARSSTVHHCQLELLGTVENTVFAGRWCGVSPNGL